MYGHHVKRYQDRRRANKQRFVAIDRKMREVMHLTGTEIVGEMDDEEEAEESKESKESTESKRGGSNSSSGGKRRSRSSSSSSSSSTESSRNRSSGSTGRGASDSMSESRLKQTMRGVSLRVTVRDTCVALLEGGEREADDEEESSEEVDKDKSGGGGSSSVRIESALVVRLERVACHHTSETTKRQSKKECLKSLRFVIFYYYFQVFEKELTILFILSPLSLSLFTTTRWITSSDRHCSGSLRSQLHATSSSSKALVCVHSARARDEWWWWQRESSRIKIWTKRKGWRLSA